MILYLIRHGRSVANEKELVTGTTQDSLTEDGVRQVEDLRKWLFETGIHPTRYITSQWKRAQQTAKILWPEHNWEIDPRVGETNAGMVSEWELGSFLAKYPDFYASTSNLYPLGESHDDLNARTIAWLVELTGSSSTEDEVVLVGHSGPISCILQYVSNMSMDEFPAYLPSHASLSKVNIPDNSIGKAFIVSFSQRCG